MFREILRHGKNAVHLDLAIGRVAGLKIDGAAGKRRVELGRELVAVGEQREGSAVREDEVHVEAVSIDGLEVGVQHRIHVALDERASKTEAVMELVEKDRDKIDGVRRGLAIGAKVPLHADAIELGVDVEGYSIKMDRL